MVKCYENGAPIVPVPVPEGRQLLQSRTNTAVALNLVIPVTFECVMEQWIVHVNNIPTTSEFVQLFKISGVDPAYNTLLQQWDFATENSQDLACVTPFRWTVGDSVQIMYSNTDTNTVSTQWWGIEVIP